MHMLVDVCEVGMAGRRRPYGMQIDSCRVGDPTWIQDCKWKSVK